MSSAPWSDSVSLCAAGAALAAGAAVAAGDTGTASVDEVAGSAIFAGAAGGAAGDAGDAPSSWASTGVATSTEATPIAVRLQGLRRARTPDWPGMERMPEVEGCDFEERRIMNGFARADGRWGRLGRWGILRTVLKFKKVAAE